MLDTKAAMAMANEYLAKPEDKTEQTTPVAPVEDPKVEDKGAPAETGTTEAAAATPQSNPGAAQETTETDKPSETETRTEKKPHFSNQKQIDYAFQKEKQKRKALQAKYDALAKELETLKANKPAPESSNADLVNYLVDVKSKENEASRIQESMRESQYAEYEQLNNARIENCFPDATEQEKFRSMVEASGPALLKKLDEADPEQAVLSFLDDSDIAPLLTRLFIAEPKYLDNVLSKRSPYGKYAAMQELAQRVEFARSKMADRGNQGSSQDVSRETPAKPAIPVVGSVTKSDATKETPQVFDPNAILAKLKSKNKYHK